MDVSSRRLALVLHRHLAEHGLLSLLALALQPCCHSPPRTSDERP